MTQTPIQYEQFSGGSPAVGQMPGVYSWFIVYCAIMALLQLMGVGMGVVILLVEPAEMDMEPLEAAITGWSLVVVGVAVMIPLAAAPFLPRRRWVWVYDLVMICLGMTSCCCLPACVPLLVYWIRPDCRQFFGWT